MTKLSKNASEFVAIFAGAVDAFCTGGAKTDVQKMIDGFKFRGSDMSDIQNLMRNKTEELELLVIEADEQLMEGYSNLTKPQQRELLAMHHIVMEQYTKPTRVKRDPSEVTEKTKREPKVKKQVVSVTPEQFSSVYTVCSKYCAMRAFVGNVTLTGHNVVCDEMFQIRFKKNVDLSVVESMTSSEVAEFIKQGTRTERTPSTTAGTTIDFVVKFD